MNYNVVGVPFPFRHEPSALGCDPNGMRDENLDSTIPYLAKAYKRNPLVLQIQGSRLQAPTVPAW